MDKDEIITTQEAADYLRVHRTTFLRYAKKHAIPFFDLAGNGRSRRWQRKDILKAMTHNPGGGEN